MSKLVDIDDMIVELAFELQAWKILYGTKEPLHYRKERERILARLEELHQFKNLNVGLLEEDYFEREDKDELREKILDEIDGVTPLEDHIDGEILDQQKQEVEEDINSDPQA